MIAMDGHESERDKHDVSKREEKEDRKQEKRRERKRKRQSERSPSESKKNSLEDGNSPAREVEDRRLY